MKRMIRASTESWLSELYDSNDILLLLKQIKELQGLYISLMGNDNGPTEIAVGDNVYPLKSNVPR